MKMLTRRLREMASTNTSVVFSAQGQVVIEDRPVPQPASGQLLMRTVRSMISPGTELSLLAGDYLPGSIWEKSAQFPACPGYANVGEVIGVGDGVDESWMGRRVASYSPHARFAATPLEFCWPIPEGVGDESACFFVFAQIAMNAVRRSSLTWGESAVIYGLGIVGQLTAKFCVLAGARPVFAVDVSDSRLEMSGKGVTPINPTRQDVRQTVQENNSGRLADVVFEVTGNAELIGTEMNALRPVGRLVVVSSPRKPAVFDFHDLCNNPSYTIIGAHNWSHPESATSLNPWTRARHAELFFDCLRENRFDLTPLITHRVEADKAPAMYQMLIDDPSSALGIVLLWD
jgi:2-desacetyl-2-hydroxyethyl bacteriochlorophyllide A dehydrogenase